MSKDYRKEIKDLIRYLDKASERDRNLEDASGSDFCRGYNAGHGSAYEACSEWLKEILEE